MLGLPTDGEMPAKNGNSLEDLMKESVEHRIVYSLRADEQDFSVWQCNHVRSFRSHNKVVIVKKCNFLTKSPTHCTKDAPKGKRSRLTKFKEVAVHTGAQKSYFGWKQVNAYCNIYEKKQEIKPLDIQFSGYYDALSGKPLIFGTQPL